MISRQIAHAASGVLARRVDRRSFLTRAALVGSAITASGWDFLLRPQSAYASVCGSGASCSSGWTAMCCTIHNGVNQCPPGSFPGGWWKADGAALCGGNARYYVDCQAECTHCGCGGGAFCAPHCRDCRGHCADGPCDKRHVCRNVFRYGQCERDRHCAGPVLCRAVSCTPPWRWANCSKASATDDATASHSASCLSGWTHIAHRYVRLGSQASVLGATVNAERTEGHAHVQHYQHGAMYWSEHTGAHYLTGKIATRYAHLHDVHSPLGLPVTDDSAGHGGREARFQHGAICEQHGHNAYALWDRIYRKWHERGGVTGPLGYPTSDLEHIGPKAERCRFDHGVILNGPQTSAHAVWGAIASHYESLGSQGGVLGFPTSDVHDLSDGGHRCSFEHGRIYDAAAVGAHALWGPTVAAYEAVNEERSPLGYPTTDVQPGPSGGTVTDFQGGAIDCADGQHGFAIWGAIFVAYAGLGREQSPLGYPTSDITPVSTTAGVGAIATFDNGYVAQAPGSATAFGFWGQIAQAWESAGGASGSLGFPVDDEFQRPDGRDECDFQHGSITYDPQTGQVVITPAPPAGNPGAAPPAGSRR